ncbi:glyoxalase [Vibrio parahaemolyticus]|nr:glyoxalase [Vibrio parahaemolyticus]EIV8634093.1 glyoxalase [Vibrio parahaemolyticus]EIZ1447975.1 glyoxalase [Vibrio parahaemolyticus]EJF4457596.1 glyoxalase [Vibrio parahaemolyticus]EJG0731655.1 glyoxalase [Vibrio parahaemolyticus]
MLTINSFVLYVENIHVSQTFYSRLFDCEVTLLSPTFASMPLSHSVKLTLKRSDALTPISMVKGGGAELSLSVADGHQLELVYNKWKEMGVDFIQPPMTSVYGLNFVATDPDKHRIRVFISE